MPNPFLRLFRLMVTNPVGVTNYRSELLCRGALPMAANFAFIGFGQAAQYISRGLLDEGAARPDITPVAWRFMRHAGPTR